MSIIVEDGSVVNGANSYASESDLSDYADARGKTIEGTPETLLIRAMDFLEAQSFIGVKANQHQPLQWPRDAVVIDGWAYTPSVLPDELKTAQLAIALAIDEGSDPLEALEPGVKRKRVKADTVESETEYRDGAASRTTSLSIPAALKKLIRGGGSQFAVARG
ncbi:MAG: DnaT-like ssDNA-binding protein [Phycisphaerae bacterium]